MTRIPFLTVMNPYYNLPSQQREVQRLVDLFNSDEAVWRKLEKLREMRRRLLKRLTKKQHTALDLLEFAAARTSDDCISRPQEESIRKTK